MTNRNRIKELKSNLNLELKSPAVGSAGSVGSRMEEVIARFGEAVVVKGSNGRVVLRGGSMADRMEALEWLAMFMPETAPSLER